MGLVSAFLSVGHVAHVGHVTWCVIDNIKSQRLRTWLEHGLTYFIGFFFFIKL